MMKILPLILIIISLSITSFGQFTPRTIPFLGERTADPNCAKIGQTYFNTGSKVYKVCSTLGTPGTWASMGGSSLSIGSSVTGLTAGSVLFGGASGVLSQNNSRLFWDNSAFEFKVTGAVQIVSGGSPLMQMTATGKLVWANAAADQIQIFPGGYNIGTGAGSLLFSVPSGASHELNVAGITAARIDGASTAGQTRFLLYDVDNGQLERVTVAAADSCGTGFKCLRIPN